jgi:hypothetical protein
MATIATVTSNVAMAAYEAVTSQSLPDADAYLVAVSTAAFGKL